LKNFSILKSSIGEKFGKLAKQFNMQWSISFSDDIQRVAIFISKSTHCLYDLLLRYKEGQLRCEIPLIVSNHTIARPIAKDFGIKFYRCFVNKQNKQTAEKKLSTLLEKEKIDTIVLARYMQIFTKNFIERFPNRIINIHHSFLPAFIGKDPYGQAYRRGVKIIGATSHYITEKLDSGPIIEQDTVRISHRDSLEDLRQKGKDLEKAVLSRAVYLHLERKILTYNNKTVIFD
jgi:formyltetrahydrofolate deformylase